MKIISPTDDPILATEFLEFLSSKVVALQDDLITIDKKRQDLDEKAEAHSNEILRLKNMINNIHASVFKKNNTEEEFSSDWNANQLLKHIVLKSPVPLTNAQVLGAYKTYPPLNRVVVINTSKIVTRLSRIATLEDSGIERRTISGVIYFGTKESFKNQEMAINENTLALT